MLASPNNATSEAVHATSKAKPSARELVEFIRVFSSTLLAAGSQTSRMDRTAARIAKAYGFDLDLAIFSRHFMLSAFATNSDGTVKERYTAVVTIVAGGFNFQRVTLLNALSWAIKDENLSLEEAWLRFHAICAQPGISLGLLCPLVATANAAVCGLFNGDYYAMGFVFIAVLISYFLAQKFLQLGLDAKVTFFLCALISSLITSLDYVTGLGQTPETAMASSVLFLIPGFPLINSTLDFWDGHVLMGISRLIQATTLIVCIALGLALTMSLLGVDKL